MLARAAVRSLRLQRAPTPGRTAVTIAQYRGYAKSITPKKPTDYKLPSTGARAAPAGQHEPTTQRPADKVAVVGQGAVAQATLTNDKPSSPEYSEKQVEFESSTENSQGNTKPVSAGAGPGRRNAEATETKSHPGYSTLQAELETRQSSDAKTAPPSTSPSAVDPAEAQRQADEPSPPLPDLTQGIPSTLDAELASAASASRADSQALNLTEDPSQASPGGRGGGGLPNSEYISSAERRRNRMANWFYASFLLASMTGTVYLGRNWETEEEELKHPEAPSGWGFALFYNRAKARLAQTLDYYNEPAFPKLLPTVDPSWEKPYTLVLSLEDLLIHSEWSREHGWRMAKRPGVDYFLRYLSQYYELVIFTSVSSMYADPVIRKLDPYYIIMWRLFREATRYKNGEYIKDLSYLNRPLNKVIMFDTVKSHAKLQPENAVILPKWKGDLQDKELISYIPFLEYLANMGFDDTRTVLKSFEGKHIPTEFATRESVARERFEKQLADERAKRPKHSGVGFFGSALGMSAPSTSPDGMESLSEGFQQGKMLQDQIRERGQKAYEIFEREIRENGEKWLKEMAEEEEKAKQEQMKGMSKSFAGMFGGGAK